MQEFKKITLMVSCNFSLRRMAIGGKKESIVVITRLGYGVVSSLNFDPRICRNPIRCVVIIFDIELNFSEIEQMNSLILSYLLPSNRLKKYFMITQKNMKFCFKKTSFFIWFCYAYSLCVQNHGGLI